MPRPYVQEDYSSLAYAVLAGMPQTEAEKILEEQREKGGKGEEVYWLTLQSETKYAKTTIQITQGLKGELEDLKVHKRESYESVIKKLKLEAERVPALEARIKELECALKTMKETYEHDIEVMKEL